jgi:hypothetical protein
MSLRLHGLSAKNDFATPHHDDLHLAHVSSRQDAGAALGKVWPSWHHQHLGDRVLVAIKSSPRRPVEQIKKIIETRLTHPSVSILC